MLRTKRGFGWIDLIIGVTALALLAFVFVPTRAGDRLRTNAELCMTNLKMNGIGFSIYAGDHDDRMPIATSWMDGLEQYTKNEPDNHCPEVSVVPMGEATRRWPGIYGYAMNSALGGANVNKVKDPDNIPLAYDSTKLLRSASDPVTSLPRPGRHAGKNNILYLDGSVRSK